MQETPTDCIVVGAGIGGLALAYSLKQRGLSVRVIEQSSRIGGVIRSEAFDGYLLEFGPNSTLGKPAFTEVVNSLGLTSAILSPEPFAQNRFIALHQSEGQHRLIPTPRGLWSALTSPLLSLSGKLRLLGEPFVGPSTRIDEDVRSFMYRRFGAEFTDHLIAAMLGGIWAADISELSCRSALPALWNLEQEYGSIVRGALKKRFAGASQKRTKLVIRSFATGMEELVRQLATKIENENIQTSTQATRITLDRTSGNYLVAVQNSVSNEAQTLSAHQVVIALPSLAAANLLSPHDSTLAEHIRGVPYAPLGVTHLAFRHDQIEHPLNGFGFLVPPRDDDFRLATLGAIFSSSLFPGRAPRGMHLLTCFSGGAVNPEFADVKNQRVCDRVILEVSRLIRASGKPQVLATTHYPHAIPNYGIGHYQIQDAVDSFHASNPQLHILSNWDRGISVTDRLESASSAADRIGQTHRNLSSTVNPQRKIA